MGVRTVMPTPFTNNLFSIPSPIARTVAVLSRSTSRLGNTASKLSEAINRTRANVPKTTGGKNRLVLNSGAGGARQEKAISGQGNANKSSVNLSLHHGNRMNPESRGPRMQPNTLMAY